ncbi:uncharacterized protein LOC141716683 [Apium graveolens]|uniref:uncharacterized protein LOC141716683 n=1 Tax=Apium graveolens TaxID=4045 RepID=UPI003D79EAAA
MVGMGFQSKWVNWMILCVSTISYKFCLNGTFIGPLQPPRGLRQRDPLSPYLFLLCVEGLSSSIHQSAVEGSIHGSQICNMAPTVTHLLFADDNFLFFKDDRVEAVTIKNLLNSIITLSGQSVNFRKFGIFFSSNVKERDRMEISDILGVSDDLRNNKYLGLPSLVGRSKKKVFEFIKDKVWRKVQGCKSKSISQAGYRWVISDSLDIDAVHDPWLKNKDSFCVDQSVDYGQDNIKVANLMEDNSKSWNVEKISQLFSEEDARLIKATHIAHSATRDRIVWSNTSNGQYSVKAGYQFWCDNFVSTSNIPQGAGWSRLWSLDIPHKAKTFLWHFCRNNIPVKRRLRARGVYLPIICPMCNLDIEHKLHLFFNYIFAASCWQYVGLQFDMSKVESAPE